MKGITMKKPQPIDELSSVRVVHEALKSLDPEARVRVLQAVMTLLQIPAQAATIQQGTQGTGGTTVPSQSNIQTTTIDKFVAAKRPRDTYQRLACLAYFLEHRENKVDLSVKDLRKANTDARQSAISNISRFLDLATRRHGFFTSAGHGKKRLGIRGTAVVEALPDQAAVKSALDQNPMPKKSGRKRKSKSKN
ncbi:MAG TPA: hypothetical protein VNI77_11305 [Nitrososphaera sp.]|nr:hypothetical protein [Nitrososphaera sp.]